ncbi:hypothetical protein [Kribbella albertanoniae]|uniref:Uncharacterized protein n=1 Tax=Kribbella albertanoniae TaxID=1266829 RepID=A0A4R4Q6I6_9ACTN|nr:hypothetical protein [Kribbella albertanoniae]TDC30768.1 hypothetical protein E1261_12580 [Kribbella albertanoniae]
MDPDDRGERPRPSSDTDDWSQLGWIARTTCGLAGGAGIYGVFLEGTNTGGVPILLVLAAFFGYLAASGQRLISLKIGDNEA